MFVGNYAHSLDSKGRVVLPAKYRRYLDGSENAFYLSQAEGCLALWLPEAFDQTVERFRERVRAGTLEKAALDGLYSNSEQVKPDTQGRILLPERLISFAGLDTDVTLVGQGDHVAIWDSTRWAESSAERDAKVAEAFAAGMGI
ncbi:MAG: division/cell wall cluster transcriptional repressor MraZ [Acidobacteria bacterium]|nr:division/cell wall cluster transcriptional repressor MraZ [Acidobacteriota bacterium]